MKIAQRAASVLIAPGNAPADAPAGHETLRAALGQVIDLGAVEERTARYGDSFVHEVDRAKLGEEACAPLVRLIDTLQRVLKEPSSWISAWQPLVAYQHGDLNLANILVDAQGSLWLIDFAKSGTMNPFTDAAFFVSRLLFQHFPLPPTLEDIQKADLSRPNLLVDTMELSNADAAKLQQLAHEDRTARRFSVDRAW